MATCVGMELTGKPLPLNHQNAFPLVLRPHTQDNGAPTPDLDPEIQIERLSYWDGNSEKLVQVNHPDLGWMGRDRDGNHTPDAGFSRMFSHMDVVEVHPLHTIFDPPTSGKGNNNTIVNWLQLSKPGQAGPRRGQHRRPLQLPRLGLAEELRQEPHRRPRPDQDA